ncbi:NnrS family protein [Leisingera thetidis]|uniref:NnrS family protein n=1 Tax=Leisingera thetidis TaxID=2930199 RepID=UPI0021F6BCBF|nr:NnrS family protein [Leisingera thetidis]
MIPFRNFGTFWAAPYRPLFFAAFLWAILSIAWWPLGVRFGLPAPELAPAVAWHVHELIFGFGAAAIGGYLLTALPAWTARPSLCGAGLKALVLIWFLARIVTAKAMTLPFAVPLALNAAYFLGLAWFICHQAVTSGAYRKLGFGVAVLALGVGEALFLSEAAGGRTWYAPDIIQAVLAGLVLMLASTGARIIPAFTRNWLAQTGYAGPPVAERARLRNTASGLLALVFALKLANYADAAHAALIAAAMALLCTMQGWRTKAVLSNPLLVALHLAYLWLPVGALILGATGLGFVRYPMADALHSITIGAMSGLILAIAGRAACRSENGIMRAGTGFMAGTLAVWITTCLRLAGPLIPAYSDGILTAAALLWCAGWLVFTAAFLPALSGPVRRPVLSGRKAKFQ